MTPSIKGYRLPANTNPSGTKTLCIIIPDDPQYRVNFWGHLSQLGQWFSWEHGIVGDTRAKNAAELWRALIYQSQLLNDEGCITDVIEVRQNPITPCILETRPSGGTWTQFADLKLCPPKIRTGTGGGVEYSYDGGSTWEPIPSQPIPPRGGVANDNRCVASANAMNVLIAMHAEVVTRYEPAVPLIAIAMGLAIALVSLIGLHIFAANIALLIGSLLTYASALANSAFTQNVKDDLLCILYENSADTAGIVTFNFSAVNAAITSQQGFADIWSVLNIYVDIIGEDGLNAAGGTTAITEANCSACNNIWCNLTGFNTNTGNWTMVDGYFDGQPGLRSVQVAATVWRCRVSFNFTLTGYAMDSVIASVFAVGTAPQLAVVKPSGAYIVYNVGTGTHNLTSAFNEGAGVYVISYAVTNGATRIYSVKASGTGTNPFTDNNCTS